MKQLCIPIILIFSICLLSNDLISQYFAPISASLGNGGNNTVVGQNAGNSNNSGNSNAIFGTESGQSMFSGSSNSYFGYHAGKSSTVASGNSFFGARAGRETLSAGANSFFGSAAGMKNTTGISNSFLGASAGLNNTTGSSNIFIGSAAGLLNTSGKENLFLGTNAGTDNTVGHSNIYIGHVSGRLNDVGSENSFLGSRSGFNIEGSRNICLGYSSGPPSFQEVSDRLFIDVEETNLPLIYGEFDNDFVKINGTFEVTAGLSNPSDINLKNNFVLIDEDEILDKVAHLDIQKWTYKDRQDEVHIGATAQDFYQAFGLGADDKHISTIDADGVALAAIKALNKENDSLKQRLLKQEKMIEKLLSRTQHLE